MVLKYYGNENIVDQVRKHILDFQNGDESRRGVLLSGFPGVGKTHLTKYLAEKMGIHLEIFNASAFRRKKEVNVIFTYTQMKKDQIIVLDECEGMKGADILRLLKESKHPIILCCNFSEQIDWRIKNECHHWNIETPPWWDFKEYIDDYKRTNSGAPLPDELAIKLAKKAISFRHLQNLLEDPDDEGHDEMLTPFEQVGESLRGRKIQKFDMQPRELISWINDNSRDPETISRADIMIERAYLRDYRFWKYAYGLLGCVRSRKRVKFPYSFAMMGKAKRINQKGESRGEVKRERVRERSENEIIVDDKILKELNKKDPKLIIEEEGEVKEEEKPSKEEKKKNVSKSQALEEWF